MTLSLAETFRHAAGLIVGAGPLLDTREAEWATIQGAQRGDVNAFATLVAAHQQFVFNLALRTVANAQEAEDIAQEVFVRAWQALPRFRGQAQFRTWLYRIALNQCYKRSPRLQRELAAIPVDETGDIPDQPASDMASGVEAGERRAFLHDQIQALPDGYRLLVMLRFQQEMSYAEIASTLDIPLGRVKTGLFRARAQLREALRAYEEGTYGFQRR